MFHTEIDILNKQTILMTVYCIQDHFYWLVWKNSMGKSFWKQIILPAAQYQLIIQSINLGKNVYFNPWLWIWFTCLMLCVSELAETHLSVFSKEETKQTALLI